VEGKGWELGGGGTQGRERVERERKGKGGIGMGRECKGNRGSRRGEGKERGGRARPWIVVQGPPSS